MTPENINAPAAVPPAKPYRRSARNILIHKPMQREFSMVLIGLLMVSTLAVAFVIHSTIREIAMGGGYRFGRISPYEVLSDISYQLVIRVSLILFATIIIIGLYGVFFLHRVAGPVHRFRRVFMRLNEGEIAGPITLREGDFFGETAEEINRLTQRLKAEKEKCSAMKEKLNQILAAHPNDTVSRAAQELKNLLDRQPEEG